MPVGFREPLIPDGFIRGRSPHHDDERWSARLESIYPLSGGKPNRQTQGSDSRTPRRNDKPRRRTNVVRLTSISSSEPESGWKRRSEGKYQHGAVCPTGARAPCLGAVRRIWTLQNLGAHSPTGVKPSGKVWQSNCSGPSYSLDADELKGRHIGLPLEFSAPPLPQLMETSVSEEERESGP